MLVSNHDTIAAIATAPGLGGIAIIRLSGQKSLSIACKMIMDKTGGRPAFKPRYMHFAYVKNQFQETIDEVLAVYMPAPSSATGEDIVEIHCHGGIGVSAAVLEACLHFGARLAEPGEFTKRAFLSGKIDLAQAEAVLEMVNAPTAEGARLAEAKLQGLFSQKISAIRKNLDALRIQAIIAADFPDEGEEGLSPQLFKETVAKAKEEVSELLAAFERAKLWREGVSAVLVGQVNAGKSSLFNALLGRNRAIVSAKAGTTRDYLEESIFLAGLPLRILDTAGLRQGEDSVELEGISRALQLAEQADLIFLVVDALKGLEEQEKDFLELCHKNGQTKKIIIVFNKTDQLTSPETKSLAALDYPHIFVSAHTGYGLPELAALAKKTIFSKEQAFGDASTDLAPNLRQSVILKNTLVELENMEHDLEKNLPPEIIGVGLDILIHALDNITGTTNTEALLDQIFASFCIGK